METQVIVVGGFLGAGKTTMLIEVARLLEASGRRTGIVLNDQGDQLVDTAYGRAQGLDAGEVTGGCFCCRFDDLVDTTIGLAEAHGLDVVLAEAVGSCADLTATVVRPLQQYHGLRFDVPPLTVVLEPRRWRDLADGDGTVAYLFRKQLEEAPVVALHKVDLLDDAERGRVLGEVRAALPAARVILTSAATGEGLDELLRLWTAHGDARQGDPRQGDGGPVADIDYATYAAAEARLAWLNVTFEVHHPRAFVPADWITRLLTGLSAECAARGAVVGHAKAQASWGTEWAKASLVRAGDAPVTALSARASAHAPRASAPASADATDASVRSAPASAQATGTSVRSAPASASSAPGSARAPGAAARSPSGTARRADVLVNARVEMDPRTLRHLLDQLVARTGAILGTEADTVHVECFRPAPPRPTHRLAKPSGKS